MKTILITCFHPLISRNILSTDVIPLLIREGDVRAVIVSPEYRTPYLSGAFGGERVIVEGVPVEEKARPRWSSLFQRLARAMLDTETMRLKASAKLHLDGRWGYYCFVSLPLAFLGHSRLMRKYFRRVDLALNGASPYARFFDTYLPDLVFSTDVQNEYDLLFMREAKRRGIRVVSMVRSWDNLSQWGLIRHIPDQLLVPAEFVREEAVRYHDVAPETITVVGIPHYDPYFRREAGSRDAFFRSVGLNPSKKLIVYAPVDDRRMRANELTRTWMENDLDRFMLEILSNLDANIWVRFPPNTPVTIGDFKPPPHMVFERPGVEHAGRGVMERDMRPEDDIRLRNLLAACDLLIAGPSTMAIDAAIFDKPVILVNFTPTPRDFWHGIIEYRYNHVQWLLGSGGTRVVKSRQELEEWIRRYLDDPSRDRGGREELVRQLCFRPDGRASERSAVALLGFLRRPSEPRYNPALAL